ncbi:T9SS type A sorting domain-containing protein [Candidatus Latescibacterota bacterium]
MPNRRDFIKTASVASAVGLANPIRTLASRHQDSTGYFGVHPFIEANPDAVFIMRTDVDVKTNSEAIKQTGLEFGRSVLIPMAESDGGIPLTHNVAIKPNITCSSHKDYSVEYGMGIVTDAYFIYGMIEGLKELGFSGDQIHMREANCSGDFVMRKYVRTSMETGATLKGGVSTIGSSDLLNWVDVPDGMAFRKIPYIWPINTPDSFLLNIAKFKAHGMGLTLTGKNHQGSVALGYCHFCKGMTGLLILKHKNPNAEIDIIASFERHKADSIPRWDKPVEGIMMEVWAQRTIDNHSVTNTGLCIIEGVYGRDGNGFHYGPNPEGNEDNYEGEAWDYMTNIIIFGKNAFHVDSVGHYLGGHEPGNMGYLHIAMERGLSSIMDPRRVPLYEWKDGTATKTGLDDFERTPLKTYYMQRNYDGQNEPKYHLVDEPFDYDTVTAVSNQGKPEAIILGQNYPNPFNPNTSIEFVLPSNGNVRLEVYNSAGQLVDVIASGYHKSGSHMASWNTNNHPSGVYFYRLRFGGFTETKKMTLLK